MRILFLLLMIEFAFITYWIFYKRTKDLINPFAITIVTWCIIAGVANLQLSYLQQPWNMMMYLVVMTFPTIVFLIGLRVRVKENYIKPVEKVILPTMYYLFSRIVLIVCVICSLIEFGAGGFNLTLLSQAVSDSKDLVVAIPFIHYGTIFLPYGFIVLIYEICFSEKRKRNCLFQLLYCTWTLFDIIFIQSSRGELLIIILGVLYVFSRRYKIPMKKIAIIVCITLIGFVIFAKIRINEGSLVYSTVEGYPLFSTIYGYTGLNFENLNKLIIKGPTYGIAHRTLWGLWQCLGVSFLMSSPKEALSTVFFNATTICYPFYDDIGYLGIIYFTILIYGTLSAIYKRSFYDSRYILLLASMQKAVWMSFFGNYFTGYRVTIFPYILTFVLVVFMKKTKKMTLPITGQEISKESE